MKEALAYPLAYRLFCQLPLQWETKPDSKILFQKCAMTHLRKNGFASRTSWRGSAEGLVLEIWGKILALCCGLCLTSQSLLSAADLIRQCAESNDGEAWNEFVSRFHRPISLSIARTAYQWGEIAQQAVDDLIQDTYLKLCTDRCRQLLEFATQHPEAVLGYVKTIAVNTTHDHFKSLHSKKRGSGEVSQIIDCDAEAAPNTVGGQEAMEREVLFKQIDECIESCLEGPDRDRDRTIFWLYYQQGMTAKDIASLPKIGLSAKGVESVIVRMIRLVRERMLAMQIQIHAKPGPGEKGFIPAESY